MKSAISNPYHSCLLVLLLLAIGLYQAPASASGIDQLLPRVERVPVPEQRPAMKQLALNTQPAPSGSGVKIRNPVAVKSSGKKISAAQGSLRQGLDAIAKNKFQRAQAIQLGMKSGSLDARILSWAIAMSNLYGTPSSQIAEISSELASWPGQETMRKNSEIALAREGLSPKDVVKAFGGQQPESLTGAILLAKSHLALGNKRAARQAIAPFWHREKLSKKSENNILKKVGAALTIEDHRIRMHYMFYRDRTTAANRMASRSEQVSLAKARTAVSKRAKNAGKKLKAVAPSSRKDLGYLFAKIQYLRRTGKVKQAAKLLASSPRDPKKLVHPDEWWVERRILSRDMLDIGNAKLAYKLAAEHSARSRVDRAEAEFHAGWYALRFLKNRQLANKHFLKILEISNTPISQARGYYWLARSNSGTKADEYYRQAARHQGTYYGQLASVKLGKRNLSMGPSSPSITDRSSFNSNELVKAIIKLEANKYEWRAVTIYRHLAKTLKTPGEIALLSARAEKRGKPKLALQIGKIAYRRGLPVITSSWPVGAIPKSAKIGSSSRVLAYSVARQESAFDHKAVSGANARGLLQLLPGTAKLMAKKTGVAYSYKKLTRNPAYNAALGSAYLSEQLSNFNGSYILTFSGYNAGPGRARDWIARYGDPRGMPLHKVIDWVERIPFTETRNYVQRVMENLQVYKARIGKSQLQIDKDLVRGKT